MNVPALVAFDSDATQIGELYHKARILAVDLTAGERLGRSSCASGYIRKKDDRGATRRNKGRSFRLTSIFDPERHDWLLDQIVCD
jgi:hypothetical protein